MILNNRDAVITMLFLCLSGWVSTAQVVYKVSVPDQVKTQLEDIRTTAGISAFTVTSYERPVSHQAKLMFDLLKCSGRNCSGIAEVKRRYCPLGDKAVDGLLADATWQDRESGLAVLAQILTVELRAAGANRTCLMHVVGSGIVSPHHAVDVAPNSIPPNMRVAFETAVRRNGKVVQARFFKPGTAEKAYHLEFPR